MQIGFNIAEDTAGNVTAETIKSKIYGYEPNYGLPIVQGVGTGMFEGNVGIRSPKDFVAAVIVDSVVSLAFVATA